MELGKFSRKLSFLWLALFGAVLGLVWNFWVIPNREVSPAENPLIPLAHTAPQIEAVRKFAVFLESNTPEARSIASVRVRPMAEPADESELSIQIKEYLFSPQLEEADRENLKLNLSERAEETTFELASLIRKSRPDAMKQRRIMMSLAGDLAARSEACRGIYRDILLEEARRIPDSVSAREFLKEVPSFGEAWVDELESEINFYRESSHSP